MIFYNIPNYVKIIFLNLCFIKIPSTINQVIILHSDSKVLPIRMSTLDLSKALVDSRT